MRLKVFFLFTIVIPLCSLAQRNELDVPSNPAIEYYKQQLSEQVMKQLNKIDFSNIGKKAAGGTALYTIPVVVHVLHDYGAELIPDSTIYNCIAIMNGFFLKTNPDTINIIDKYKSVAANTQIAFKLATKDPHGNQTKGIEHICTYLTNSNLNFRDQSKLNQWPTGAIFKHLGYKQLFRNISWIVSGICLLSFSSSLSALL
jgi:hypothetical protein